MDPCVTPVETPVTAPEAADALLGLVETLVPIHERPAFRAHLHRAAQTLFGALHAGASAGDVLDALVGLTAPPVEAPPFEPWRFLLAMTFDEFAKSSVGLDIRLPKLAERIWLAADEFTQARVVRESGVWARFVKLPSWMALEADQRKLPETERTVGRFIEALEGKVVGWRAPEGRG